MRIVFTMLCLLGTCSFAVDRPATQRKPQTPAERIKSLEVENASLREEISRLKAIIASNGNVAEQLAKAQEMTQTDLDRADDSIRQMMFDRTICKLDQNGPFMSVTMNRQKWESLTIEQREQFVTAIADWTKTKVHPRLQSKVMVLILADDRTLHLAEYMDGKVSLTRY